jgi:hypothetical protein
MAINNSATLQIEINRLQQQCYEKKEVLHQQFTDVVESFKPANLFKSAVKDIAGTPGIAKTAIETSIAIGAGVLTKKLIVGKSTNVFKRILGGVVEFTVANGIANNAEVIADKGIDMLKKLSNRIKE